MSGSLDYKLDRIVGRAAELRAILSEVIGGEAFTRASKELSEIAPIVDRIDELRDAERANADAQALAVRSRDEGPRRGRAVRA